MSHILPNLPAPSVNKVRISHTVNVLVWVGVVADAFGSSAVSEILGGVAYLALALSIAVSLTLFNKGFVIYMAVSAYKKNEQLFSLPVWHSRIYDVIILATLIAVDAGIGWVVAYFVHIIALDYCFMTLGKCAEFAEKQAKSELENER